MAETSQTLFEFTNSLLSDLDQGVITAQEALSACNQYAYLREVIASEGDRLSQVALLEESEFAKVLRGLLAQTAEKLKELPSFQSQQPDKKLSESDVRNTAALRAAAMNKVKETTAARLVPYRAQRRVFIHDLVSRFSSTLPVPPNEQQLGHIVDQSLVAAAAEATTAQTKDRFAELLTASMETGGAALPADIKTKLKEDIRTTLAAQDEYISTSLSRTSAGQALTKTLFQNIDIERPDVLVDVVLNAPQGEPQQDVLARGLKLAGVAAVLQHSGASPTSPRQFFTSANARGAARGFQQAADGLLSLVGEPVREMLIQEKINGTLRSMLTNSQSFIDRLGENFVRSAIFTQIAQNLTKSLSEKPSAGQARGVLGDVVSSIFRGPLDPAITQGATGRILDYFELARANANAPKGSEFLPSNISLWRAFPDRVLASRRGFFFPSLGFGVVGGWLGDAFATGVNNAISFFLSNPRMPWSFAAARRRVSRPTPFWEDTPLVITLIIVAFLVVFFLLPWPLNFPQLSQGQKIAALINALRQVEPEVSHEVICTDCKWPTNGCISQGPFTPYDSHHDGIDANAVDIAAGLGEKVVSITDGDVVASVDNCFNFVSPGCGDGYGNHVDVRATNGKVYRYAHLMKGSTIDNEVHVAKGTVIGLVDSSGNSTGSHLHFELVYGQSGSVNDVLPLKVPACVGQYEWMPGPNCPSLMGGSDKSCVSIQ